VDEREDSDVTPEEINAKFGRVVWKCNRCGATEGLYWWGGMSVAICPKQECYDAEKKAFDGAFSDGDDERYL
jgi:hypothetical protein